MPSCQHPTKPTPHCRAYPECQTRADKLAIPWESLFGRILCLGRYTQGNYDTNLDHQLIPHLRELFRHHPQSGIHSICDWILRKMPDRTCTSLGALNDQTMANNPKLTNLEFIRQAERELIAEFAPHPNEPAKPKPNFNWYVERTGETMVVIDVPSTSDNTKSKFAYSNRFTTMQEFKRFANTPIQLQFLPTPRHPRSTVDLANALGYCNWLTLNNKFGDSDCCVPNGEHIFNPQKCEVPKDYLSRRGSDSQPCPNSMRSMALGP